MKLDIRFATETTMSKYAKQLETQEKPGSWCMS